jgi:tRNA pseudouridine55 synthase
MNGLLLVDKPCGITSFDVVRRVRRWCGTRQVGHCGTLDPQASGVLPVAVGSATRLVEYLMAGDKEYTATLRFGVVTDTQDATGQVVATHPLDNLERLSLEAAAMAFLGTISQVPPMYSALKRDGVPLYRLARQGIDVDRQPRLVRIEALEILEFTPPHAVMRVTCSKGTYIRTLCHDLGQKLGCGAHMAALRRTRCGSFRLESCHALEQLEEIAASGQSLPLITPADALCDWPGFQVHETARKRLANGVAPALAEVSGPGPVADGMPVRLLVDDVLAALARFVPGGEGGRPGDFALDKVFPEAISLP